MLKIGRSHDRLIFSMEIPIPGKDGLYIETGPRMVAPGIAAVWHAQLALSSYHFDIYLILIQGGLLMGLSRFSSCLTIDAAAQDTTLKVSL